MPHPYRKILPGNAPGTTTQFGGRDYNILTSWFEDIDLTAGVWEAFPYPARVATPTEFRDNRLRFLNILRTHSIRIRTLNFTDDYNLTIPLMEADDEFMLLALQQNIYNKTFDIASNTFTTTGIALGDLLGVDPTATKFIRVPIGLPGQILTVKEDGLNWEWADPPETPTSGGGIPDDNSVTTIKIVDGAVTNDKLAGSISGDKILNDAISTDKIGNLQVTDAKIANATITAGKITNATITNAQIAATTILGTNMANSAIGTLQIADNAVTTAKIGNGQITSGKLATGVAGAPFLTHETWGMAAGQNTTSLGAVGILDPLTPIRTHSRSFGASFGNVFAGTGTTANTQAGQRTTNPYTRRSMNPKLFVRFDLNPITNSRLFIGWASSTTLPTSSDNWLDTLHGAGLMLRNNGTELRIVRNDGSATDAETSSGFPAPVTTATSVYLELNDATPSLTYKIWTSNSGDSSFTPDKEGTATTILPDSTTNLYFWMVVTNSTTTESFYGRGVVYARNKW